jgi:alkylation response protein AidB-like acyl-CoA dehydrogenase
LSNSKEKGRLGQEAAIIKILATELAQEISTFFLETMGHDILPLCQDGVSEPWFDQAGVFEGAPAATSKYLCDRSQTIYGGTNEIQRNLIAKRILGM